MPRYGPAAGRLRARRSARSRRTSLFPAGQRRLAQRTTDMTAVLTAGAGKARPRRTPTPTRATTTTTRNPQVEATLARAFGFRRNPPAMPACAAWSSCSPSAIRERRLPQWWPKRGEIARRITFNDGVMIGILNVLMDAADRAPHFAWFAGPRAAGRARCAEAVARHRVPTENANPGADGAPILGPAARRVTLRDLRRAGVRAAVRVAGGHRQTVRFPHARRPARAEVVRGDRGGGRVLREDQSSTASASSARRRRARNLCATTRTPMWSWCPIAKAPPPLWGPHDRARHGG